VVTGVDFVTVPTSDPNPTHRGFNQPACYGPKPESSWLTVGTPDHNGVFGIGDTVFATAGLFFP
jgi:hypothetical protein